MNCPNCQQKGSKVIDSRADALLIRRRRRCFACNCRWTTYEMDTQTIERLKAPADSFGERAEDVLGLLDAAMELVTAAKRDSQPLLLLHGTRMRSKAVRLNHQPSKEHLPLSE